MTTKQPTAMPAKARPEIPADQSRIPVKDDGIGNEFQVEYAVDDGDIDIPERLLSIITISILNKTVSNLKYTKWVRWLS